MRMSLRDNTQIDAITKVVDSGKMQKTRQGRYRFG